MMSRLASQSIDPLLGSCSDRVMTPFHHTVTLSETLFPAAVLLFFSWKSCKNREEFRGVRGGYFHKSELHRSVIQNYLRKPSSVRKIPNCFFSKRSYQGPCAVLFSHSSSTGSFCILWGLKGALSYDSAGQDWITTQQTQCERMRTRTPSFPSEESYCI